MAKPPMITCELREWELLPNDVAVGRAYGDRRHDGHRNWEIVRIKYYSKSEYKDDFLIRTSPPNGAIYRLRKEWKRITPIGTSTTGNQGSGK
jgi:hypothetical protein